ncbi:AMP-binding protein [Kibdelosporangium aridum]|uniref:AMP-binding protein n=1 Tax=Kibdelosporangium aridum TaxID=2030 RepID=UPI000690676D|nr:AMP-binding protein [Kibdelosporangium aridum]
MGETLLDGTTLAESLAALSRSAPDSVALFPSHGRITAAELHESSIRSANAFLDDGIEPGDVVGVLMPTTPSIFNTLFGLWRAGAAVSVLPVQVGFGDVRAVAQRLASIIATAGMRHLVLGNSYDKVGHALRELVPALTIVDPEVSGSARALPAVDEDSLAIVQFTSGSTSAPKGVMLPHRTAIAGLRACVVSGNFSPDDVFVQWVPMYHDMGLIGLMSHWLNGADVHVFSPAEFLRRPERLLRHFAEHRGTVLTGPNFSYDYMLDAITPELLATLDLSSWRLAFNGAEPVSAATVRRFTDTFAACGVRESVMYPVYGMAEATLSISYPTPGDPAKIITIDRQELASSGVARTVPEDHPDARAAVSVGRPVHGIGVRIVGEDGEILPPGMLGEIQITGESVTTGYYRAPEATARTFDGEWLRTGDLGFELAGELYIGGRIKEMVIVRGQNFFPDDVEAIASAVPGVYKRRCVAFSDTDESGTERVGVIVEVAGSGSPDAVRAEVIRRIAAELSLSDVDVRVVKPRWLTRTTSGKWQRTLAGRRTSTLGRKDHGR